jgi:pimeloyl-ACP methyl ester carboxylesterase
MFVTPAVRVKSRRHPVSFRAPARITLHLHSHGRSRMKKWQKRTLVGVGAVLAAWFAVGLILIATPAPTFDAKAHAIPPRGANEACVEAPGTRCFTLRDGNALHGESIGSSAATTILLLHGIMSSSEEMRPAASALHEATGATVVSLDLRGHGQSAGAFGDIDYIGQHEDDVADVVAVLRKSDPNGRLILAGHSMGGGIAMRYAAKPGLPPVDGYLLYAPHLGERSPSTPHAEVASASKVESPLKLHLRRTIGLLMLNTFGVRAFNGLGTLYFNVAQDGELLHYSFRAMATCAPDDYALSLSADDKPLLIVAGSADEAFKASEYPAVVKLHRGGRALVVPGQTHDGVLTDNVALTAIVEWMH